MPSIIQSALHPAGAQAARIEGLWWLMFWVCTVVWVLVMAALGAALLRGRGGRSVATSPQTLVRVVATAIGVSTMVLIGLLAASVMTGRAVGSLAAPDALVIQITGYQWWWHIEYLNPDPSLRVTTANELHLPTGRPIAITLKSGDVIHSFWVPSLHGKIDLVPGRQNTTWLNVERPGVYRGQCAEFCGLQHANMALAVVAEPPGQFEQWLAAQRLPPRAPATAQQRRGLELIERGACMMCHAIRGTTAGGRTAPDLTHFATRSTIAAGTVPNTRENLARWIVDPQHLKPGNRMPSTGLSGEDLEAVVAYLETLR
jgi:cytochrome c oxidase subunit 2